MPSEISRLFAVALPVAACTPARGGTLLWIKGVREGRPIDYRLCFSDTDVRSPQGGRYVLGPASLPLPR